MKFTEGTLIIGGDLNLALHPDQDSSSSQQILEHTAPPSPPPISGLLAGAAPNGSQLHLLLNDPLNIHKARLLPHTTSKPDGAHHRRDSTNDLVRPLPDPHTDEVTAVHTQTNVVAAERIAFI
ncbi:Hypothetical predicted protein [Pelobates cultripes]|uniref:Uncharacterized protein n=1 Tax=Pelobates cultripes TaxID=61616 RepID=A0AAD1VWN3_PELCU|nr:Hypothetical predicted protein [Pelobates cultripes]